MLRRSRILAFRSVKAFFDDGCGQRAAAISYYVLFSIFPLVIFSVGIMGLVLKDTKLQNDLVDNIMNNIPLSQDKGRNDVTQALQNVAHTRSGAIGVIGLLGLAWSGSSMFGVVRGALNNAFHGQTNRPLVMGKLIDLGLVLAFAPFFIGSVVATSALRYAQTRSESLPVLSDMARAMGAGWAVAAIVLPILISSVAFFLLYWLIPTRRVKPRYALPGALLAAVLFEGVKIGFNVYIENFSSYDVVFGSLGAVVAFLFWVYISANIMLFGAEVVSEIPDVVAGRFDAPQPSNQPSQPLGKKVLRLLSSLVVRSPDHPESLHQDEEAAQRESH